MNFISKLERAPHRLNNPIMYAAFMKGMLLFKKLNIGDYTISIQASKYHACAPQENLNPEEYTQFELQFSKNNKIISIDELPKIERFDKETYQLIKESEDETEYHELKDFIYPYIPVDMVNSILNHIYKYKFY